MVLISEMFCNFLGILWALEVPTCLIKLLTKLPLIPLKLLSPKVWKRLFWSYFNRGSLNDLMNYSTMKVFVEQPQLYRVSQTTSHDKLNQGIWIYICCTLRSGLHKISTMIRAFPHGLENNHACKWISDNFPRMLTYILFLENCLKSICLHDCSPIHVELSFFFLKVLDRFVP